MLVDKTLMKSSRLLDFHFLCNLFPNLIGIILVISIITPFSVLNATNSFAAEADKDIPPDIYHLFHDSENAAKEISKVVGVSISPLLGMSVVGAYGYYKTNESNRPNLPWHSSPKFWAPLLIVLFLFIIKDAVKTIIPLPKFILVPLDALEALENKISAVIAVPFVLSTINALHIDAIKGVAAKFSFSILSVAYAGNHITESLATDWTTTLYILLLSFIALSSFFLVWLVSHTINIFILLSPFSIIDFLLKLFRLFIISLLLVANIFNPFLSLGLALILVVIAFFISGWAFRFMVFGSLTSIDILLRRYRHTENHRHDRGIKAFAGRIIERVPSMSYGIIKYDGGNELEFSYRPFLVFPKRKILIGLDGVEIGKGNIGPILIKSNKNKKGHVNVFRLRPLYKYSEEYIAQTIGGAVVRDISFGKGMRQAWLWFRSQFATTAPQ